MITYPQYSSPKPDEKIPSIKSFKLIIIKYYDYENHYTHLFIACQQNMRKKTPRSRHGRENGVSWIHVVNASFCNLFLFCESNEAPADLT
jgi:hypothetical protein